MAEGNSAASPVATGVGGLTHRVGRLPLALIVALSVLVVALAVTAVFLLTARHRAGVFVRAYQQATSSRNTVLAAAKQEAVNMVSQDYRHIDADLNRMTAGATGPLKDDLAKSRTQAKDVIVKYKIISTGQVFDAGLAALSGDQATVLVIVDNTVTNTAQKTTGTQRHRFQLDLTRAGSTWLVSNLTAIDLTS